MHAFLKVTAVLAGAAALTFGGTATAMAAGPSSSGAKHTSTTECAPADPTFCITITELVNPVSTPSGNTNVVDQQVETFGYPGEAPFKDVQLGHDLTRNGQVQQSTYLGRFTDPGILSCTVHTVIANGQTRVDRSGCR